MAAKSSLSSTAALEEDEDMLNPQSNRDRKKLQKMQRKERAKQQRLLSAAMAGCEGDNDGDYTMSGAASTPDEEGDTMMDGDGDSDSDYDFAQDFGGF
jgi:hypothetical protein